MIHQIRSLLRYYRMINNGDDRYECRLVDETSLLQGAQQLHAAVYLAKGYVRPEEINENGILHVEGDPYQEHAYYFTVKNKQTNQLAASARLIYAPANSTLADFQTLTHLKLFDEARSILAKYKADDCLEVSALVRVQNENSLAVLMLYREMWQFTLKQGHRLWLMSCNANLYTRLRFLFGNALQPIGPKQSFRNHMFIPVMIEIESSLNNLLRNSYSRNPIDRALKRRLVRFFLNGVPDSALDKDALSHLH